MRRRAGATLLEVLVGCGVFTFLMISSIAIMNIGANGYRAVESKSDVTRQLNRFEADIVQELRRASLRSVGLYTPSNDFHWAIWMKTPMNAPGCFDPNTGNVITLGDPAVQVTSSGSAKMQRYVVYYVTRMDAALHQKLYGYLCASYSTNDGPDVTCPHKWIVKKDVYLLDHKTTGTDSIGVQSDALATTHLTALTTDSTVTEPALAAESESNDPSSDIHRVQVVAHNVLSFEVTRMALAAGDPLAPPTVSSTGPIVLFDVKVFKALDAAKVRVGTSAAVTVNQASVGGMNMVDVHSATDAQGSTTVHTSTSIAPTFGAFTVQVDNRVIPQNP